MIFIKQKRLYFIIISIVILILDQLSKYLISLNYGILENKNFILFNINIVRNYGAAFNIFTGNRIFLSLVSFIISLFIIYFILTINKDNNIDFYSYSFILGGTLGNGLDRILKGYVIDFINLKFINFPVFNIADISINIGFILILYSLFKIKKRI